MKVRLVCTLPTEHVMLIHTRKIDDWFVLRVEANNNLRNYVKLHRLHSLRNNHIFSYILVGLVFLDEFCKMRLIIVS